MGEVYRAKDTRLDRTVAGLLEVNVIVIGPEVGVDLDGLEQR